MRREWRVRRRDGSLSSLRELTTLQRWIVEGTLSREDEIGLDGETWRMLGTIPDLGVFFVAADAKAQLASVEAELALLKSKAPGNASRPDVAGVVSSEAGAAAPTPSPSPPARVLTREAPSAPSFSPPPVLREAPHPSRAAPSTPNLPEPAFTRTAAGLGLAPTDDWEPPKLSRGLGAGVVLLLLFLGLGAAGAWAYVRIWLPEQQRAREEQERNGELQQKQQEHDAQLHAAEQKAKEELLQALAAGKAQDGGVQSPPDAGPPPRGALEPVPALAPPAEARVSVPTLVAAPLRPPGGPSDSSEASPAATTAPPALHGTAQTFEDWMAEADRRRTHERASSALAAYDRALGLKPLRSDAHAGRGLALLDLGRRPEALAEFQRALELDPQDGIAVLGLAETYRALGRSEEAGRAYQRYLDGWPGGADARAARAALESLKE